MNVFRLRPVLVPWTCHQTGDCCRVPGAVVMTAEERTAIEQAAPSRIGLMAWTVSPDGLHELSAGPCPLLDGNRCSVYDARPYNCRRFMCGRVEPEKERFEDGPNGCLNFTQRLGDRRFRSHARQVQTKARVWADAHGWGAR